MARFRRTNASSPSSPKLISIDISSIIHTIQYHIITGHTIVSSIEFLSSFLFKKHWMFFSWGNLVRMQSTIFNWSWDVMAAAILVAFDTYISVPWAFQLTMLGRSSHDKPWETLYLLRRRDSGFSINSTRRPATDWDQIWWNAVCHFFVPWKPKIQFCLNLSHHDKTKYITGTTKF